jgi:hypothetical protein
MFNIVKNYKQNDLLKVGFRFIQIIIQFLYKIIGEPIKRIKKVLSFDVELEVSGKNTFPLMVFLKTIVYAYLQV